MSAHYDTLSHPMSRLIAHACALPFKSAILHTSSICAAAGAISPLTWGRCGTQTALILPSFIRSGLTILMLFDIVSNIRLQFRPRMSMIECAPTFTQSTRRGVMHLNRSCSFTLSLPRLCDEPPQPSPPIYDCGRVQYLLLTQWVCLRTFSSDH